MDGLADVSIRTFPDPLLRFRRSSLHPPASYDLWPHDPLVPPTLARVLRLVRRGGLAAEVAVEGRWGAAEAAGRKAHEDMDGSCRYG